MKINLTILDSDKEYLRRLVEKLSVDYSDSLEIHSYSEVENIYATLEENGSAVFLVGDNCPVEPERLPQNCCLAFLTATPDKERLKDYANVGKFQKPELIYKQVLALYAEFGGRSVGGGINGGQAAILAFQPVSGGSGSSTVAAAGAVYFATKGKKVLYLNLEKTGSAESFFHGPGHYTMSDLIYTLKSSKGNLAIKLESCLREDPRGVCFYAPSPVALDMFELSSQDSIRLVEAAARSGGYDYIILDLDFSIRAEMLEILRLANAVQWVGTGDSISNGKLIRAYQALKILEEKQRAPLTARLTVIFNQLHTNSTTVLENEVRNYGIPKVSLKSGNKEQILEFIASMEMFDELIH